jgi:NAD(P)-dependent dehydrogenase (short-subunit alcohol dehydrogenase family)
MTDIVLVTGANKGIGFHTARLLGARGCTVLVGARDEQRGSEAEAALREDRVDARFVRLDVTDEKSIRLAAEWIDGQFGRLDVLVNNAGITGSGAKPSETSLEAMRTVYETNVFGVVATTNAMLPLLRRATAARIVNVSSEVGSLTSMSVPDGLLWQLDAVPYPSSKAALNMVTVQYAKELRDTPIKVNAANPGYCATDLNGHGGYRTAEQGAEISVHLATLPPDGPTGVLWGDLALAPSATGDSGVLPW